MPQLYRHRRPLGLLLALFVMAGGVGLGLLPQHSGEGVGAATTPPQVGFQSRMVEDREEGEILINGQVAVRIRVGMGWFSAAERAQIAAQRLQKALAQGKQPQDLAVGKLNEQVVIMMGEIPLITVDEQHAVINRTSPEGLAAIWLNQIRAALEGRPVSSATEPGALTGVFTVKGSFAEVGDKFDAILTSDPQSPRPITWRTIQNNQAGYWQAQAVYPELETGKGPDEAPLAHFANLKLAEAANAAVEAHVQKTLETVGRSGRPKEASLFTLRSTVALFRPEIISVLYTTEVSTGGAQKAVTFTTFNYALAKDGPVRLQLRDLFLPSAEATRLASERVFAKLKENLDATFVRDGKWRGLNEEMAERFVIGSDSLLFLFPPQEVAPSEVGSFVVKVPFSEFGDQLNPQGPLEPLLIRRPEPEPVEVLADKFVPILSAGEGVRVGVARVSGPKSAVDTVKAVAQIEGEYRRIARGRLFVPVASEEVVKDLKRVHGVSVTGYADLRF